jgi:BlaI family penicillinase repressor
MTPKISDSELEVMRILWREGRPLSFTEIRTELERNTEWSKSTVQTLVVRLRDKGIISVQTHHVALYSPNITEQEYISAEGKTFLDKLFDGNAKKLVASLCQNGQLAEDDIDELKQFFKIEDDTNDTFPVK